MDLKKDGGRGFSRPLRLSVGTSIARPRLRSKQSPDKAILPGVLSEADLSSEPGWICLQQIAFVPNAGRAYGKWGKRPVAAHTCAPRDALCSAGNLPADSHQLPRLSILTSYFSMVAPVLHSSLPYVII